MNEKLLQMKDKLINFWKSRTTKQRVILISSIVSLFILVGAISILASKPNLVPLYSNLSLQETGQIQDTLTARGVKYEISNDGTTISVPKDMVNTLMVDLAAEGIPDSGNIDYSFFGQNSSFGVTDKEFNVIKLDAMQTELGNLIKNIDGVENANVMLTIPEPSIWVGQEESPASASIVITQKPGYKFDQKQINALYHLVSKSVPNLPVDNIVIMNQLFQPFAIKDQNSEEFTAGEAFSNQYQIKKEIETDIQRQVQQMLGTMIGMDKVLVSVTADLDFTKEKRTEERYEPVDKTNDTGIARSVEKITETFTGNGNVAGGVITGQQDVPNMAQVNGANGDYEKIEERVNNEVDKINKEIVESPYQIRDLGIQVVVDPTTSATGKQTPAVLNQTDQDNLRNEIEQMLSTVIRTSIPQDPTQPITNVTDKISITMQPFQGRQIMNAPQPTVPTWMYIAGGILLAIIGMLVFLILRRRKDTATEKVVEAEEELPFVPDVNVEKESESGVRRKQLEKMAKEKPDEFAKLLRTWIAED